VIRSIIEKAEKEVTAASKEVKIFKFEHALAPEFLLVAGPLLGIAEDETANEEGTLTISTDPIGNRIIASGTAKMLQEFETIFKAIDVDPGVLWVELPAVVMLSFLVLLVCLSPMKKGEFRIRRWEGALLFGTYLWLGSWIL